MSLYHILQLILGHIRFSIIGIPPHGDLTSSITVNIAPVTVSIRVTLPSIKIDKLIVTVWHVNSRAVRSVRLVLFCASVRIGNVNFHTVVRRVQIRILIELA